MALEFTKEKMMRTLSVNGLKQYSPEHDAIMREALVPVTGYYDASGLWSVKVPEQFTFVEFKSGWDQDDYIHNRKAHEIAVDLGVRFEVMQDYPRYTSAHCVDALRFYFDHLEDAYMFIGAVKLAMLRDMEEVTA